MTRDDSWTAEWSREKLISHNEVTNVTPVNGNLITLSVKKIEPPIKVATISRYVVSAADIKDAVGTDNVEFILNIPKNSLIMREAIEMAESISVGIGGLGDLYTAINERNFKEYTPKETRFILRGLGQHTAVTRVVRENNRLYRVERFSLKALKILALNEYDLTAEAVRDGIDRFGQCDIILPSNPNCRPSPESIRAAKYSGARVLKWGQLLGALNY